jgi:amino acid adenylation domain-containing protein
MTMKQPSTLSPAKQALLKQRLKRASHSRVGHLQIPRRPNPEVAPLSFIQHQMWVIDQITPGNPAYNMPYGYRLQGALDVAALEASVNEVIKRHEVLRTTFALSGGEPLEFIHAALTIKIRVTELDHLPAAERERRLQAMGSEESAKSFDLSRLPLIRVSLFKLGQAEHVLILNLHHIVADGLSIGLLMNELDTFYRSFTDGGDPCLPELAVQYGDFALWQRRAVTNQGAYAQQIEFWRTQLGGRLPVLELPADKPRPALQSFKGSNVFFFIPAALAQRVKSLGEREGCTFFMIMAAAFQVLLHRYSGADDIVIGTPVATRTPEEVGPLIGLVLNMAALRCDLSGDPTFNELLRRTREMTLDTFSNSEVPFEVMLNHLQFERDPSRNPVFQVVLQVLANTIPRLGALEISSFHFDLKFAQFDLTLHLYEEAGDYQGRFEYCSDLFEAETIRRLCEHFKTILEAIVREPDQSISKLPMLTDAERQQLIVEWNETAVDYPRDSAVHEVFEKQARRTPDAVAVDYEGRRLTYRELNHRANQVAHYLGRHGVGPEKMVAICMERSLEMIVGLLGILKAGGAYVALDPQYPSERLEFMLADAQVSIVLTQEGLLEHAGSRMDNSDCRTSILNASMQRICLDRDWELIAGESSANPENNTTADNLAYVIYTSGSTGQPKGVQITHKSLLNLVFWHHQVFSVTPTDRATQLAGPGFDAAVWELWPYLNLGATVHIPDDMTRLDAAALRDWLVAKAITISFVPTAIAQTLVTLDWPPETALRVLLTGGDKLDVYPPEKLPFKVFNNYGPTECTVVATSGQLLPNDHSVHPPLIGRPIANTQVYILDEYLNPVPIGVLGEIYIGGDGLARGYFGRSELTAKKFIADPFSTIGGSRLYKTGDLARYRGDGNIEFLGRIDNQVKIRGFRIEPGEIEARLREHPAVRETLVLACEDASVTPSSNRTDKRLVAYVIAGPEPAPGVQELRDFLKEKLPEYMIPSAFVFLASLPLTPNGKVDRKALPLPDRNRAESEIIVAPRDETETILCRLWAQILKIDQVGIDDNFFALGGHSLLAANLFTRLDETFGRSLPLGTLFTAPTVRALAEKYRAAEERNFRSLVALRPGGSLPAIFAVPGVFGNVVGFADLARELGADQPFYGLQSLGLDGKERPIETIEEMAHLYINEIRSVQARGPYALIGACFGATVVYEIARQLLKDGEAIAFLGLFGPTFHTRRKMPKFVPRTMRRVAAIGTFVSGRFYLYLHELYEHPGCNRIKYLATKIRSLSRLFKDDYATKGVQRELYQIEVYRANLGAVDQYLPEPLSGPLTSLEIFDTEHDYKINSFGRPFDWGDLWKGSLIKHRVAGRDSGDMLSGDNARLLARLIVKRLRTIFSQTFLHE